MPPVTGFAGGALDEIPNPALALPDITQDYLYLAYEYADQLQVCRIDLACSSTAYEMSTDLDTDHG